MIGQETATGEVRVLSKKSTVRSATTRTTTTEGAVEGQNSDNKGLNVVGSPVPASVSESASSCNRAGNHSPQTVTVSTDQAPVFIGPRVLAVSLTTLSVGAVVPVVQAEGDWYLVRFEDRRWGSRVGYVHCANVGTQTVPKSSEDTRLASSTSTSAPPLRPSEPVHAAVQPSDQPENASKAAAQGTKSETVAGYVEWLRADQLIADGQRVRWDSHTRMKLGRQASITSVPLGYEIKVKGVRLADGALLAQQLDVKPNGIAAYENEVIQATNALEAAWASQGAAFLIDDKGNRVDIGRIVESGPDVERARRVLGRLVPPYVSASRLRVRVIQTKAWNASAMDNGAIWVNKGLLDDVSDDELAAVLGHELAHYTHEHSRRGARNGALVQLAEIWARVAVENIEHTGRSTALAVGADLSLSAWQNRYSRGLEDQADRVGLRYAHEAGYDVTAALRLWKRARERDGELDSISNFFLGDHSRPTDRIKNIERELLLNYAPPAGQ